MFQKLWKFIRNPLEYFRQRKRMQELRKRDPFIYK